LNGQAGGESFAEERHRRKGGRESAAGEPKGGRKGFGGEKGGMGGKTVVFRVVQGEVKLETVFFSGFWGIRECRVEKGARVWGPEEGVALTQKRREPVNRAGGVNGSIKGVIFPPLTHRNSIKMHFDWGALVREPNVGG